MTQTYLFSPKPDFYVRETRTLTCTNCQDTQTTTTYLVCVPLLDDHGRPKATGSQTRPLNGNESVYAGIEIRLRYHNNTTPICPDCEDTYRRPPAPVFDYQKILNEHDPIKAKKINDAAEARLASMARGGGKTIVRPAKPAATAPKKPADILSMLAAMTKK